MKWVGFFETSGVIYLNYALFHIPQEPKRQLHRRNDVKIRNFNAVYKLM